MHDKQYMFLSGGGEMGQLMRAHDWEATSVGSPATWPQALCTMVSVLLHSKFPMFLLWGDDFIQFYNDAYRPSLGSDGKHPAALGQSGEECWKEAWPILGPMLQQVRTGGEAVWKEDQYVPIYRNGKIETTYWTFSYSPVFDDAGKVGGVLSTCVETTAKVADSEQLKERSEELLFAIDATELGVWDFNPHTGRFSANSRLKQWFGLKPDEEIPLQLAIDVIAAPDRDRVSASIARALEYSSGGKYEELYTIVSRDGRQERIVLAKGRAWFDEAGIAYRFNGTLQDITERREAEIAQKEVEERFRNVSNTSPTGLWLSDKEGGLIYLNKTLVDWTGMAYAELLGAGWADAIVEEDRQRAGLTFLSAVEARVHYDVEFRIRKYDGSIIWCRAAGDPFYDQDGAYAGYSGFCMDINDQKFISDKIAESRAMLLSSFEESPVAIATVDKHGLVFTNVNRFYGELVGRKPKDIIGKPLLVALPELAGQGFDKLLENVIATGTPYVSKEVSVDLMRNDKMETRYVDLVYQPQFDSSKHATGVLAVAIDITEQVLSRRVIEESEAKFRALIEQAPIATCLFVGRDMTIEIANDLMLGYWGKDKVVLGQPLLQALPELEGQSFPGILESVFNTGVAHTEVGAVAQLEINGKVDNYFFDYTYKPIRNGQGEVYAIMNMAINVTEQVMARKQLEESERFSRSIFNNSPVAKLVYVGGDMVLRDANEAMLEIFGRDASILNKPIMETVPELKETDLLNKYRRVLTTGEPHYEYAERILLIKKGEKYWGYYDYIYKPLRNVHDQIYGVICTAIEVTKEVTTRQRIESAEASLRDAIELAELATWSIDVTSNAVQYSERMQHWLGIRNAKLEMEGSPRLHPKDQDRIAVAVKAALDPAGTGSFDEIYTIVNAISGQERIIHANGRTKFDDNGNPISLSGTAQDVTLQQELQKTLESEVQERTEELATSNEELEILNTDLRRSNEELAQYAYVASHDLQEPLRKIRVFSDMLNAQQDINEFTRNYLEKINHSASRMTLLIKDLLEFSKLVNSEEMKRQVDLTSIVQEVKSDFELLISERNAVVQVAELPVIEAVPLQMNQLFYNIISNALKFVPADVVPDIKISAELVSVSELGYYIRKPLSGRNYYKITVADNGIGFDQKYAEQIFEVFKRLHKKEFYPGSGIGLALCRRIVGNHGGHLYSESEAGKGAAFHIILPA